MRTPKGKTGIEMFREYFQLQQSKPLSVAEQSIMTHLIWLMNDNLSEEVNITLRQLSVRCNVDVRTIKAKIPQLVEKGYLGRAEINGEVCMVGYKNVGGSPNFGGEFCSLPNKNVAKSGIIPSFSEHNKLINKNNIINGNFDSKKVGDDNGNLPRFYEGLTLADL